MVKLDKVRASPKRNGTYCIRIQWTPCLKHERLAKKNLSYRASVRRSPVTMGTWWTRNFLRAVINEAFKAPNKVEHQAPRSKGQIMRHTIPPANKYSWKPKPLSSHVAVVTPTRVAEKNGCPDLIRDVAWCISSFITPHMSKILGASGMGMMELSG